MGKIATVHLFPTGRLGNQLYFASMASAVRQEFSKLGIEVRLVLHSKEPLPALKFIMNLDFDHESRDSLIRLIIGNRTLSKSNLFFRASFKLYQLLYSIRSHSLIQFTDLAQITNGRTILITQSQQDYRFFEHISQPLMEYQKEAFCHLLDQSELLEINFETVVAIHMRFGDYLAADTAAQYGNLSSDYYRRALLAVSGARPLSSLEVQLFSDEPEKGIQLLAEIGVNNISTLPFEKFSAAEELIIMSKFKKIVLSNSTFSWWAGYFAAKDALVVAPNPLMLRAESSLSRSPHWIYVEGWT